MPAALRAAHAGWAGDSGRNWSGGCAALGAHGEPPCRTQGLVLVADARLDDRAGLARELGLDPAQPDGRLILAAYERWGAECPRHLAGAYAFAVWDERRAALFCARDHIGFRPLHYWHGGGEFLFASDPEALLATGRPSGAVDETAFVAKLVEHHGILRERSFHAGILKLPPGESLLVSPGGAVRRSTHWAPGPRTPLRLGRREEYADALRESLTVAVRDAVRGPGRIGAHCSGGIDSSAVAVLAQDALRQEGRSLAHLFSWSPPPETPAVQDERGRVCRLAATLGLDVSWVSLTLADLDADFARDVRLVPNQTVLYEHAILREARACDIGVLLSGWGGDETASFDGRGHSRWLARSGRWGLLFSETRTSSRRRGHRGLRLARNLTVRMLRAGFRGRDRGAVWTDLTDLHPMAAEMQRDLIRRTHTRVSPRDTQVSLLASGHVTSRVEAWAHVGARAGVEYRYPLLDRRLIDLCLSFPPEVWVKDGINRWPFRAATSSLLPEEICWGPKIEPARIDSMLDLFLGAWQPPAQAGDPERARLVALVKERQRETLRRQRSETTDSTASAT